MADKRLRLIVEAVTSGAQQALRSFSNTVKQVGDQTQRNLDKPTRAAEEMGAGLATLSRAATFYLADIGMRYGRMAADAIASSMQMAAANQAIEASFINVANQYGLSSSQIIEALKKASKSTINEYGLMAAASTAMRLGVATDIDEFEKLMKIAYIRARETGKSVEEAWNWITIGIGRASPRVLDNLNILIQTNDVLEEHARLLDKNADELSTLEQQEAIRNEVIRQGQTDLENWSDATYDAVDAQERYTATMAEFRQEVSERVLPAYTDFIEELTTLPTILEQLGYIIGVTTAGTLAFYQALDQTTDIVSLLTGEALLNAAVIGAQAAQAYAAKDAARELNQQWGEFHQISAAARKGTIDLANAQEKLAKDVEFAAKAASRAADIWADYYSKVAHENWQFQRQVEDTQFRAAQAAERAAFELMQIERDAADRRSDLLQQASIRFEAQTARHYAQLRWMKQDFMDELADMEWDYQRERSDIMKRSPWWIRQALQREFQERERIAATGDMNALREFDRTLTERIRLIDPIYAEELDLLQEHYEHQAEIEERESRQAQQREQEDWRISSREQERSLDQQLRELDRNLQHRLEEWHFHQRQREESERWSMDRMLQEHTYRLDRMKADLEGRLADQALTWGHYGYEHRKEYAEGWSRAAVDYPITMPSVEGGVNVGGGGLTGGVNVGLQQGAWDIPQNMIVGVHRGEMVIPSGPAERIREGGGMVNLTIENMNFYGGYGPGLGRRVVEDIERELGRDYRWRAA